MPCCIKFNFAVAFARLVEGLSFARDRLCVVIVLIKLNRSMFVDFDHFWQISPIDPYYYDLVIKRPSCTPGKCIVPVSLNF